VVFCKIKDYEKLIQTHEVNAKMSETFVNDGRHETVDAVQLSHQPTVDMGTPVDLPTAATSFNSNGGDVVSASMPPLLRSDDIGGAAVKTEICELQPVDSMPHLMPMITDEKKDDDTENWVPMVRQWNRGHFYARLKNRDWQLPISNFRILALHYNQCQP